MSAPAANPPLTATAASGKQPAPAFIALIVGIVGLAISAFGLFQGLQASDPRPFLGVLLGASYWLTIGIGMLFLILLSYVFDAGWATVLRRQWEHGVAALPWIGLILLPLFLLALLQPGNGAIPWTWLSEANIIPGDKTVGEDPLYIAKSGYLDGAFFFARFVFYFACWIGIAYLLRKHSFAMDKDGDPKHYRACRRWSAVGIIVAGLTISFAAIDWYKSLEYHWFSTIYGVWFFAACMRAAIAVSIILLYVLTARGWLKGLFNKSHSYLLGSLALAFTVFWAYISFSQYFLQYNANIPEEVFWYNMRLIGPNSYEFTSWWVVAMVLVFFHFFFPFLYLIFYNAKFGKAVLFISAWILLIHSLDLYFNILPAKLPADEFPGYIYRQFSVSIWDIAAFIGVGGVAVWAFLTSAAKQKPIPIRDPRILESVNYHE